MFKFFKSTCGNIVVLTAMSMFAMMLFMSMAIDVSKVLTARNQLQSAVDAAALAGASGLLQSQAVARNRALAFAASNNCLNQAVDFSAGHISFPTANQIHCHAFRDVSCFFARVININSIKVNAEATAQITPVGGTNGFRPFAVPDMHWVTGDVVLIKANDKNAPCRTACWEYPVCFPPINRGNPETGADIYDYNVRYGTRHWVYVNDVLLIEVGTMTGPTQHSIDYLVSLDPNAYWKNDQKMIVGSNFPGYSSPRVIKIPLFDSAITPDNGRSDLQVIGFASFFVVGMQNAKDVEAIFLEITTIGPANHDGGSGSNSCYTVRLIA